MRARDPPVVRLRVRADRPLGRCPWRSGCGRAMCDLEDVSPTVPHHRSSISIGCVKRLFYGQGAGCDGPAVGDVGVIDIDVKEGRESLPFTCFAQHDERVADSNLCGAPLLNFAACSEDRTEEFNRACDIRNDHAGRD